MQSLLLSLLALSAVSAEGAVTFFFSTSNNVAEGWANSAGSKTATMAWGIVVDTQGDGFDGFAGATTVSSDGGQLVTSGASYDGGFTLTSTDTLGVGQLLSVGGAASDDRLYISRNLTVLVSGDVRITGLHNFIYDANMGAGDKYAIVWFDATALDTTLHFGDKYGAWYKDGPTISTGTILPTDFGTYSTPAQGPPGMFGPDGTASTKVASLTLVPEPATAVMGLLGAAGLFIRRRRSAW